MITAGVDVGTRFLKICIVEDRRTLAFLSREMKGRFNSLYRGLFQEALELASRERGTRVSRRSVKRIVSTGYGSHLVKRVTRGLNESVCTARGAWEQDNSIKTVIDAGGFFIRVISVGNNGRPLHCHVNENCAAGSGKFLEMIAEALDVPFDMVSGKVSQSTSPLVITGSCAVFAESDVITEANRGRLPEDILAGVVTSIASKTATLMEGAGADQPLAITGGLAAMPSFIEALEKRTGRCIPVLSPLEPGKLTAYGAALIAAELRPAGIFRRSHLYEKRTSCREGDRHR